MNRLILTVNAGSSNYKLSLHDGENQGGLLRLAQTLIEMPDRSEDEIREAETAPLPACMHTLLAWVAATGKGATPAVAVHRVVHGGPCMTGPLEVDSAVLAEIDALASLAPIHQRRATRVMRVLALAYPGLPQLACFDSDFHRGHADWADRFALPRALHDAGVRRYGFHGINYAHVAERLVIEAPHLARGRVIVAHLGNGSSLCALREGRSIETTMGLTALDGVPMGTRCGAIDPGVLLWLLRQGYDADSLERLLYHESGLLGVSGISSDMRVLLADGSMTARQAIELLVARIAREIGALAAALGGVDGLVFTGGIGEHAAPVRAAICERTAWLGVRLDAAANERNVARLSLPTSNVDVRIVPANEERILAQAGRAHLAGHVELPGRRKSGA
jgi:acetate kinase